MPPITTHDVTPTGIVTSHPTPTTYPTDVIHATPQTRAGLTPATPTALHRNLSQEKTSNVQDPIIPKTDNIQDSPSDSDSNSYHLNY